MLKGVIFDWDGVVVDSSAAHKASWEMLAAERGLPLPENHFARSFGRKNQVIIPEIYNWSDDPEEIEELGHRKEALYREILSENGLDPLPGAIELFRELKAAGIPMAVGTSTPRENVDTVIGLIGAEGFFDAIISSEDVHRGKPDPEVFLKAAEALGAAPGDCVVFEDSLHGIEAAIAGGMKAVALTTTHPAEHFDTEPPHRIVGTLADVGLPSLERLWKTGLRILHLASRKPNKQVWNPRFFEALRAFGDLRIEEDTVDWDAERVAAACRESDVVLTHWGSRPLPECLAENPGRLRYICNLSGSIRPFVPRKLVEAGISVTNWGNLPAFQVAEGALTLLLVVLKQVIPRREHILKGEWILCDPPGGGSVRGLRLGVYGLGVVGSAFLKQVRNLEPQLCGFDPYVGEWSEGVRRVSSVEELCDESDAIVITAALTPETRGSVTASALARLPDGGIVVNVARGAIIEQPALFAELEAGRLRAGLDVLDSDGKDYLEPGHPARKWPNLVLGTHKISEREWNIRLYEANRLSPHQMVCLANLRRFVSGMPLQNLFDLDRYDRST